MPKGSTTLPPVVMPSLTDSAHPIGCVLVLLAMVLTGSMSSPALATDDRRIVRSMLEMRHQSLIRQRWDLSCAAAALATVLRYQHNEPVTERSVAMGLIDRPEYLADPRLVRLRQGFSLLDMQRFVETMGFNGVGLGRLAIDDLIANAPIIVPINSNGYPHFVVFRGAAGSRVLLGDPAFGNATMSREEFESSWIDYGDLGRVGFFVRHGSEPDPPGALAPYLSQYLVLH